MTWHPRGMVTSGLAATLVAALGAAACTTPATEVDPADRLTDYLGDLEAICANTAMQLEALPDPPAEITVNDFATQAGSILLDEAEQMRSLDAPDDLDDDHRALIRNGEEQAGEWKQLADVGTSGTNSDALADVTTRITGLNLGRNDLVAEMGAPSCARVSG